MRLRFLRPLPGERVSRKQGKCGHTCHFRAAGGPAKVLVGEPPQTRPFGTKCPKGYAAEPTLPGLFLIGVSAGEIEQVVDVALGRDDFPHLLLGGAVSGGKGLLLLYQLPALFLERVHLREFFTVQQLIHGGPRRPVVGQLRLMLGQIFSAVPGRLIAVEHRPGLGVLHHRPHELRCAGQRLLHVPELPGQGVGVIHRRLGLGLQLGIVGQAIFLEKLQGGGHLLEVVELGPPLIARPLALGHALLDVNDEVELPGLGPGVPAAPGTGRGPALQDGLHVLGAVAVPQGGAPPAGGPLKARELEREDAAPPVDHLDACRLQRGEKGREISRGLGQHLVDDSPELLLLRGLPDAAQPLAVVEKAPLTVELRILDDGQLMLDAHPVGEPPQGKGGADEVAKLPGAVIGSGIVIDVIMQMAFVNVGADKELILALRPAQGRFIADLVCLLGGELPLGERLPDLIAQGPALHLPARLRPILALHQQELGVGRGGIAEIGGHRPQLFRVEPIVKAVFQALQGRPVGGLFVWPNVCCGRGSTSSV